MRYKGLDLNLLVALDLLLSERSVSRAGEKLYRSQSTVSGALARLREYFGDDLLMPVGRGMQPTPRGAELAHAVRDILMQIEAKVLTRPEFDPASAERTISIFASDYLMIGGLADTMRVIQKEAPKIRFAIEQPSQFHRSSEPPSRMLENGLFDLLAMPQIFMSEKHPYEPLFEETFCCIVWRDNQDVGDSLTLGEFLKLPHVVVSFGETAPSYETWFVERFGAARQIDIIAGSFSTVPFLIPGTRRVALAHRRLAEAFSRILPLRIVDTPFDVPNLTEAVQWHSYASSDIGLMWVKDRMVKAMAPQPK